MNEFHIPHDLLKVSPETITAIHNGRPGTFEAQGKVIHVGHAFDVVRGDYDHSADVILCCSPAMVRRLCPSLPIWGDWTGITNAWFDSEGNFLFVEKEGKGLSHRQIWQALG